MSAAPDITVAIPTYNGARYLRQALRGILAQEGPEFDLVVSDDRSDDETIQVAREAAGDRARLHVNSERLGLAGNWNRCVASSRTAWVAIFHQDDVMRPGHLAAHRAAITAVSEPRIGLVAGAADVIDSVGDVVPAARVEPGLEPCAKVITFMPGAFAARLAVANPLRCSAVTTSRDAHADVGGFDASYRYVVDWDFWWRVARRWGVALAAGPPTVSVRWHPASETHRFKRGTHDLEETGRFLEAIHAAITAAPEEARVLRRAVKARLARAYVNRAYDAAHAGDGHLVRHALAQAIRRHPACLARIAADPRLAARLALGLAGVGPSSP